jgi:hypothetical protein
LPALEYNSRVLSCEARCSDQEILRSTALMPTPELRHPLELEEAVGGRDEHVRVEEVEHGALNRCMRPGFPARCSA